MDMMTGEMYECGISFYATLGVFFATAVPAHTNTHMHTHTHTLTHKDSESGKRPANRLVW